MLKINLKKKKTVAVLLLSLLILATAVGVTLAYIVEITATKENVFIPVEVDSEPVATAQGGLAVKNSGDIPAYIRAVVIVNWVAVDEEGNAAGGIHVNAPLEGVDYSATYDATGAWQKGSDGFWYYKAPVVVGKTTAPLVTSLARLTEPPAGYRLSVEVLSAGIQTTPAAAVETAWGVTLSGAAILPN